MITPSIVSAARSRLVRRRERARRRSSRTLMPRSARRRRWIWRPAGGGDLGVVGDEHDRAARGVAARGGRPSTSAPAWLSRLPVGSSARMSAGSVTIARATATRCCWPPDSSVGSWSSAIAEAQALQRGRAPGALRSAPADALVEQRRRDVVERAWSAAAGCRTGRRSRWSGCGPGPARRRRASPTAVPAERVARRPSAGPGSPGCSSSCSCRSPTGPTIATNSPGLDVEADVVEGGHLDVAHLVDPADPVEGDDRARSWPAVGDRRRRCRGCCRRRRCGRPGRRRPGRRAAEAAVRGRRSRSARWPCR